MRGEPLETGQGPDDVESSYFLTITSVTFLVFYFFLTVLFILFIYVIVEPVSFVITKNAGTINFIIVIITIKN